VQNQPVKGMRDFYPEQMNRRSWLFSKFRETARRFNFIEYDACVLESEELYVRKAGDEITHQLYNFEDKSGRKLALRPELTPSLARMILARHSEITFPIRWFSIAQCFRYEKMQKGRKREHYQWNMDLVGEPSIAAELELLSALVDFFASVGLTEKDITIRFSNRNLLSEYLSKLGLQEGSLPAVSVIVDKLDKVGPQTVKSMLVEVGCDSSTADRVIAFIKAADLDEVRELIGYEPTASTDIRALLDGAKLLGIDGFLRFTPELVRGLSYYTGTVFEAFEASGEGRAVCGGGRYDRLIETFGGPSIPMVGFGFGDVVIMLALAERNLVPAQSPQSKVLVASYSNNESPEAIRIARSLRASDIQVELDLSCPKLRKLLTRGDRQGFRYVILAAPDEIRQGQILVKDLAHGSEQRIPLHTASEHIVNKMMRGT
jgi:histidyl-tRNA synthetase